MLCGRFVGLGWLILIAQTYRLNGIIFGLIWRNSQTAVDLFSIRFLRVPSLPYGCGFVIISG
jgi:hypothetical protein